MVCCFFFFICCLPLLSFFFLPFFGSGLWVWMRSFPFGQEKNPIIVVFKTKRSVSRYKWIHMDGWRVVSWMQSLTKKTVVQIWKLTWDQDCLGKTPEDGNVHVVSVHLLCSNGYDAFCGETTLKNKIKEPNPQRTQNMNAWTKKMHVIVEFPMNEHTKKMV